MQTNDRYSSRLRNSDGSIALARTETQELKLIEKVGSNWKCQGWYSNEPTVFYDWTVPEQTILAQFTKV